MPRGRQYYDPIVQVPGTVEGDPDRSRIELYPEGSADDPNPKWRGRLIAADGSIAAVSPGDFDQERAQAHAQQMWPGLEVYVLREEGQDSTWEGHGPSPRLWQNSSPETGVVVAPPAVSLLDGPSPDAAALGAGDEVPPPVEDAVEIHPFIVPQGGIRLDMPEGTYMPLDEICTLLEAWAVSYEESKNPSGAMALREAVDMLKDIR